MRTERATQNNDEPERCERARPARRHDRPACRGRTRNGHYALVAADPVLLRQLVDEGDIDRVFALATVEDMAQAWLAEQRRERRADEGRGRRSALVGIGTLVAWRVVERCRPTSGEPIGVSRRC